MDSIITFPEYPDIAYVRVSDTTKKIVAYVTEDNCPAVPYTVSRKQGTCTCRDYIISRIPCRHICAVFRKFNLTWAEVEAGARQESPWKPDLKVIEGLNQQSQPLYCLPHFDHEGMNFVSIQETEQVPADSESDQPSRIVECQEQAQEVPKQLGTKDEIQPHQEAEEKYSGERLSMLVTNVYHRVLELTTANIETRKDCIESLEAFQKRLSLVILPPPTSTPSRRSRKSSLRRDVT